MEVGKYEPQSKAYMVKESVSNKPKALVSHERISNYYTAGNWGRKHINDINVLSLVVCLKSPKSALLLSVFSRSKG